WSLFASPVAGVGYGGHGVLGWGDGKRTPVAPEYTRKASAWYEALDLPRALSMRQVSELLASPPRWRFRPTPHLLPLPPGTKDARHTIVATCTDDGQVALVYIPRGAGGKLKLAIGDTPPTRVTWIDARDASRQQAEIPSDPIAELAIPEGEDWLLMLEW